MYDSQVQTSNILQVDNYSTKLCTYYTSMQDSEIFLKVYKGLNNKLVTEKGKHIVLLKSISYE